VSITVDDFAPPAGQPAARVVSRGRLGAREALERALRPKLLHDYVGQAKAREQLESSSARPGSAARRWTTCCCSARPAWARPRSATSSRRAGRELRQTSGPVLEKPKDLAALLTSLEKNDVLFIDEIHRLSPVVEEILYPRWRTTRSTS
jgi:Holliday junction DNA helicase RuvB